MSESYVKETQRRADEAWEELECREMDHLEYFKAAQRYMALSDAARKASNREISKLLQEALDANETLLADLDAVKTKLEAIST